MSSLLEQAIVDAKALKEAALKNAESAIIDKYSNEVKSTLNKLLEQDELADILGATTDAPAADEPEAEAAPEAVQDEIAADVPEAFMEDVAELDGVEEGDSSQVTIDFQELAEALKELREEVEGEEVLDEAGCSPGQRDDETFEEVELDEESIKEMVEAMLADDDKELEEANLAQKAWKAIFGDGGQAEYDEKMAKMRAKRAKELEILKKYQDDVARRDKLKANDARRDAMDLRDPDDPRYEDVVGSVYGIYEEDEKESLYEELSDELIDAIMEKLTVDMGATLSGWAGRSEESVKHQMELEMAHRRSTEVAEELEALKKAQEELVFENKKLKQSLTDHQSVISSLKESVQDVNLSNARLLYTNRVLRNTSLNERQKDKIVEAISKAGSVEEAKTIHETLQSTVASAPKSRPQSLSEAITRPTSIIRASRKEEPKADPFTTRMRKLAGIE
jgi:hypothetical protein